MTKGEAIRIVEYMAARQDKLGGSGFMTTNEHAALKRLLQEVKSSGRP